MSQTIFEEFFKEAAAVAQCEFDEIVANTRKFAKSIITEDDEPVDNVFSEKQQRLLTEPLYSSWTPPTKEGSEEDLRKFFAAVNVGVYFALRKSPLVPDMFLSLDVEVESEHLIEEQRAYFVWEFGKVPDVVVEIVSNRKGNEMDEKFRKYAEWAISYYVVFDPMQKLGGGVLQVFGMNSGKNYHLRDDFVLPTVGLSLTLWKGTFEGVKGEWLRWCDIDGNLILSGAERAEFESEKAELEYNRAEKLADKLRELGVDPEKI